MWHLEVNEDDDAKRYQISESGGKYYVDGMEFETLEEAIRYIGNN